MKKALTSMVDSGMEKFCLHAVRLHTNDDFAVRYVDDAGKARDIFAAHKAIVVAKDTGADQKGGWFVVHKTKLTDALTVNARLKKMGVEVDDLQTRQCMISRKAIMSCKGRYKMLRLSRDISEYELEGLGHMSISIVKFGSGMIISVPEQLQHYIRSKKLLDTASKIGKEHRDRAATVIQSCYRGYVTRTLFKEHQATVKEKQDLEVKLAAIKAKEAKLKSRLFPI